MNARITSTISAAAFVLAASAAANAAITSVSGGVTQISPPLACGPGQLISPFNAFAWDELQGVPASGVICDETMNPGSSAAPVLGAITGTFDSHFLNFEPVPGVIATSGTINFSSAIRGVIYRAQFLDFTDAPFGAPGTAYPTTYPLRGLSNFPASNFTVVGNTLNFTFFYPIGSGEVFQMRILTDHNVPAPTALGVFAGAGAIVSRRRRR